MRTDHAIKLFDPMDGETLRAPFGAYRRLRGLCPVGYLAPLDLWVVSRYDDVRAVLGDSEAFSTAMAFGGNRVVSDARVPGRHIAVGFAGDDGSVVSSTDGRAHTRLRRMMARLFARPYLDAIEADVGAFVRGRLEAMAADDVGTFDAVQELVKPTATRAISRLMGIPPAIGERLTAWVELTFRALDPADVRSSSEGRNAVVRTNLACIRDVRRFIADRRARGADREPIDAVLRDWHEEPFAGTEHELILSLLQLYQAGYETVVAALSHLVWLVATGDAPLPTGDEHVARLADEAFRLASPVRATLRGATRPATIGGVAIPEGALVLVLLGSANRDEHAFGPDPDRVVLDRPSTHVAFGGGMHQCLGMSMARIEVRQVVRSLAAATTAISLADEPRFTANLLKAGCDALPVQMLWRSVPAHARGGAAG